MVYRDWREVLNDFDDKLYRELMEAIFDLGLDNKETATSPLVKVAMKLIKPQILRDWEKAEERRKRNKMNGLKGGRPLSQENPENPAGSAETQKTHSVISVTEKPKEPSGGIYIKNKKQEIKYEKQEDILDEQSSSLALSTENAAPKEKPIDYVGIMNFYNKSMHGRKIAQIRGLSEDRKQAIHARIVQYGIDAVYEVITKAARSDFLNGHNDKNWSPDATWLFGPKNFIKVLEGRYDNNSPFGNGNNGNSNEQRARTVGEKVLGDIFTEIEEHKRADGAAG